MLATLLIGLTAGTLAAAPISIYSEELVEVGADRTAKQLNFDFDADGDDELITVLFTEKGFVQIVVTEATLDDAVFPATTVTIEHFARSATVEVVDAGVAGMPLLKVAGSLEACGPYTTTWLSYTHEGGRSKVGELQTALELVGMSDPPVWAHFDVEFDRLNRRAVVTWTYEEDYDEDARSSTEVVLYELTPRGTFSKMK